jgi:uncharacterized SAM-dependent methyltransferase
MMSEFAKAVDAGLGAEEKSIPSKYFYDEAGSPDISGYHADAGILPDRL